MIAASFTQEYEAHLFLDRLRSEGIEGYIFDNNITSANPFLSNAVGGIKVYVAGEDEERMREVLIQIQKEKEEQQPYGAEIKVGEHYCIKADNYYPNCDSFNTYTRRFGFIQTMISAVFALISLRAPFGQRNFCVDCRHKWDG